MQRYRAIAGLLAGLMTGGIAAGCGGGRPAPSEGPTGMPGSQQAPQRTGMSNRNKVLLLAGAAAVYYLWKKNQNKPETARGKEGRYYRSKNGRVYYRDAQGKAHWVTPPQQPIQIPAEDYQRYFGRDPGSFEDRRLIREAPQGVL